MIAVKPSAPESLKLERIQEILRLPGPCVTLLLPPYHPGEPAGSSAAFLKASLQDAARQVAERKFSGSAALLQPLEHLAADPTVLAGSRWSRGIFCSPEVFQQFQLTQPVSSSLTVAGCFDIRPLLPELWFPRVFYILTLSKERVNLRRCTDLRLEAVELPSGVADTLEEAMSFEPPDHDLENRSSAGSSQGTMRGVRFGTGSGRETQHTHLADFYKLVDRGVQKLLHEAGAPLVLAGVDEDTAMYRSVSAYPHLLRDSIHSGGDAWSPEADTLRLACSILRAESLQREAKALADAKERATPRRFSTDPYEILHAAFEGRVNRLYLDEGAERLGVFERGTYRSWGKEDLLNLAAVETIVHGGKAFALPRDLMPEQAAAAATMRF